MAAACRHQGLARWLHRAGLVDGAALQNSRCALPIPGNAETGETVGQDRLLKLSLGPAFTAIGGDFDAGDAAAAAPGQAP